MAFQETYASFAAEPPEEPAPDLDLFVCRACLATDIKLFDIQECDLAQEYENVTGLPVPVNDGLPQHLCPYCFALLEKCSMFINKCKRTVEILEAVGNLSRPITMEYIRLIDRNAEGLAQTHSVHSKKVEVVTIASPAKPPVVKKTSSALNRSAIAPSPRGFCDDSGSEEEEQVQFRMLSHKEVAMDSGELEDNPFAKQGATVFRSAAKAVVGPGWEETETKRRVRGSLQKVLMEACDEDPGTRAALTPPPPLVLPPVPSKMPRKRRRSGDPVEPTPRHYGPHVSLPAGYPGCAAALQHALRLRGASLASLAMLPGSLSAATFRQYDSFYRRWWRFCTRRDLDPYERNMPAVLEYFTERLSGGASTFQARANRRALALLLGREVSRHEELTQLIRSYVRPETGPRYTGTWDPNLVLDRLSDWYPNSELKLDQISKKLVTLIALTTCHVYMSLARVLFEDITIDSEGVKFRCRRRRIREVYVPCYKEDPRICPVVCLLDYLRMTESIRQPDCKYVIINVKRPYGRAAGQTLMRWVHRMLTMSGVNMSIFEGPKASEAAGQFKCEFITFDNMRQQAELIGPAAHFIETYRANW